MGEGDEDNKLREAVQRTLALASEKGFRSISMPAISSGNFRFPKDKCANILVQESKRFLEEKTIKTISSIHIIEFCIIDDDTFQCFKNESANVKSR